MVLDEGSAKGWSLKGKAFSSGVQITIKKPGSTIWETKFQALKDHFQDQALLDAIEFERSILCKRMGEVRAQERGRNAPVQQDVIDVAAASQSDGESARDKQMAKGSGIKRRKLHISLTGVEAAATSDFITVGNSQFDLEPISSSSLDEPKQTLSSASSSGVGMWQITHGAAIGWTIKAMSFKNGKPRFYFCRPRGTNFERLAYLRSGLDSAVLSALERGQDSMAARLDVKHAGVHNAADTVNLSPSPSGLSRRKNGEDLAAQAENRFLIESTSSRGRKRYLSHNLAGKVRGTARAKVRTSPPVADSRSSPVAVPRLIEGDIHDRSSHTGVPDVD